MINNDTCTRVNESLLYKVKWGYIKITQRVPPIAVTTSISYMYRQLCRVHSFSQYFDSLIEQLFYIPLPYLDYIFNKEILFMNNLKS